MGMIVSRMPDELPRPFTRKQAFWLAAHGPALVAQMALEDGANIAGNLGDDAARALAHYRTHQGPGPLSAEAYQRDIIIPFCTAFFAKTYPVEKPALRQVEVMRWIHDRYLNDRHNDRQILVEDLYKIGERILYFTGLKTAGRLSPGEKITDYASLEVLDERLAPFDRTRQFKEAARLERFMPAEKQARIMRESTLLYDGRAGRIVVPHTVESSRYWGNQTKWCLSGEDEADLHFPDYNREGPVIFFLPRGGEKMALVDEKYWDPRDQAHLFPNNAVARLLQAAQESVAPPVAGMLRSSIPLPDVPEGEDEWDDDPQDKQPHGLSHLTPEEQAWVHKIISFCCGGEQDTNFPESIWGNKPIFMAVVRQNGIALQWADKMLRKDREIVLAAVQQNGSALRWADKTLCKDRKIVLTAVQKNCSALGCAHETLRKDREIVLAAVQQNGFAIEYADETLRRDRKIVLAAVQQDGLALKYADKTLRNDREIVLAAVQQNGFAIEYADETLRRDPEIIAAALPKIAAAIQKNVRSFNGVDESLREDPVFVCSILDRLNPERVFELLDYLSPTACLDDDTVLGYQIRALETLLDRGQDVRATQYLRFIKPLWGSGERIFGAPAAQLDGLLSRAPGRAYGMPGAGFRPVFSQEPIPAV